MNHDDDDDDDDDGGGVLLAWYAFQTGRSYPAWSRPNPRPNLRSETTTMASRPAMAKTDPPYISMGFSDDCCAPTITDVGEAKKHHRRTSAAMRVRDLIVVVVVVMVVVVVVVVNTNTMMRSS